MPDLLLPLALAALAGILFWFTFVSLVKARTIENVPTSKIRSAHQGYVELTGTVSRAEGKVLIGPLTGLECVWYDYHIERYQGGKEKDWVTIEHDCSELSFTITDDTGECVIQPKGSDVTTTSSKEWYGYERHPRKTVSVSSFRRLMRARYRYTERRIEVNQPIYAIGWFQTKHAPTFSEQENVSQRRLLNNWKQDYPSLLSQFDHNRDGAIDLQEWEQVRMAAANEAKQEVKDRGPITSVNYLMKPSNGQPWLLSTEKPDQLSQRYREQSAFTLALCLASSIGSVWQFIQQ